MSGIRIKIRGRGWSKDRDAVIGRIAAVVCGSRRRMIARIHPRYQAWSLDYEGGDWTATWIGDDEIDVQHRRYDPELMRSLKHVLQWIFDKDDC